MKKSSCYLLETILGLSYPSLFLQIISSGFTSFFLGFTSFLKSGSRTFHTLSECHAYLSITSTGWVPGTQYMLNKCINGVICSQVPQPLMVKASFLSECCLAPRGVQVLTVHSSVRGAGKAVWEPLLCFQHCFTASRSINSFTPHRHLLGRSLDRCRATKLRGERNLPRCPYLGSSGCLFASCLSHIIYHLMCGLSRSHHSLVHVRASLGATCDGPGVFLM